MIFGAYNPLVLIDLKKLETPTQVDATMICAQETSLGLPQCRERKTPATN